MVSYIFFMHSDDKARFRTNAGQAREGTWSVIYLQHTSAYSSLNKFVVIFSI